MLQPALLLTLEQALEWRARAREDRLAVVFTNGCFDLIHRGHVDYLYKAGQFGDRLLVALNSDDSVRRLKGPGRPFTPLDARTRVVSALRCVDAVTAFSQDTPLELIQTLSPDVLVKGADYSLEEVVGHEDVLAAGGRVELIPLTPGQSTSALARKTGKEPRSSA